MMENWMFLSAFSLGFLGSFHCAGMCGPIAAALPNFGHSKTRQLFSRLFYNLGRIISYSLLGMLAGLAGIQFKEDGWQAGLSIFSGVLILIMTFLFSGQAEKFFYSKAAPLLQKLKKGLRTALGSQHTLAPLATGALNGFLPCGFVYLALAAALSGGSVAQSAAYMTLFGLGTVPMMLSISLGAMFTGNRLRKYFHKLSPWVAVVIAVLLISRGIRAGSEASCCQAPSASQGSAIQPSFR